MDYTNPSLILPVLLSVTFVVTGILLQKFPPKKINNTYGYRTPNAIKSQARWDFAQQFSAKELIGLGLRMPIALVVNFFPELSPAWSIGIILVFMLMLMFRLLNKTENALEEKFGK